MTDITPLPPASKRYMLLLNMTGDTTVAWDEADDEKMRAWVQSMLDKGYAFFMLEKTWWGLREKRVELTHVDELKARKVSFEKITTGDAGMDEAFQQGLVSVGKAPDQAVETVAKATSVDEVLRNDTVAFRPIAGG